MWTYFNGKRKYRKREKRSPRVSATEGNRSGVRFSFACVYKLYIYNMCVCEDIDPQDTVLNSEKPTKVGGGARPGCRHASHILGGNQKPQPGGVFLSTCFYTLFLNSIVRSVKCAPNSRSRLGLKTK